MPTFTTATPADASTLLPLMRAFYTEEQLAFTPHVEAALRQLLADPSLGRALLIHHGHDLAGYCILCFTFSLEAGGRAALLDELFILPAHRRKGLATAALRHAFTTAAALACRAILLEVNHHNPLAKALYLAHGFAHPARDLLVRTLP
jgi:GNAT superfamily N-acetyltransferase